MNISRFAFPTTIHFGPGARTEQRPSDLRRWSDRRDRESTGG